MGDNIIGSFSKKLCLPQNLCLAEITSTEISVPQNYIPCTYCIVMYCDVSKYSNKMVLCMCPDGADFVAQRSTFYCGAARRIFKEQV